MNNLKILNEQTPKNKTPMNKLKYIAAVLIGIAGLSLQQAKADSFTFNLTAGNAAVSGFPQPYISVTVDRTSTTMATITFNSLTTGGYTYLMVDGGAAGVNVNATSWTIGSFSYQQPATGGFVAQPAGFPKDGGAGNEDGFGSFNQKVDGFDSTDHAMSQIQFTLTNTSGTPWLNAGAVLVQNDTTHKAIAAAHIVVFNANNVVNGHQLATGFAAGSGVSINPLSTPDGGTTVMLLGTALGALGMARRFLKR
jgi:hypothetical protein